MIHARAGRRQQQENEIHRHPVDRRELDRLGQLGEQRHDMIETVDLAMRNGDAAAEAGRSQPLAFAQPLGHLARVEAEPLRRQIGRVLEQSLFRGRRQIMEDGLGRQDVAEIVHRSLTCVNRQSFRRGSQPFAAFGSTHPIVPSPRR